MRKTGASRGQLHRMVVAQMTTTRTTTIPRSSRIIRRATILKIGQTSAIKAQSRQLMVPMETPVKIVAVTLQATIRSLK